MSNQESSSSKDTHSRLVGLQQMIQSVYMSCMSKPDLKHHMKKFVENIQTSIQQAYGNVTINVPDIPSEMSEEQVGRNPELMEKLTKAVQEWTQTIVETMEQAENRSKGRLHDTASGEAEFWATRSATFNTLYQQLSMHSVKRIETVSLIQIPQRLQILNAKDSGQENQALENFRVKRTSFNKEHSKAKDFVKFLTTLERQFKNITHGDLKAIEDTLPSLLNGLKLIWTISRHINQNDEKFQDILEAISNEICQRVKEKIDIKKIFKEKPHTALEVIKQGISLLGRWKDEYDKTKTAIEQESTITRWDFAKYKEIFNRPRHMRSVLENFREAMIALQEFYAILGPDLKAVVGSTSSIESRIDQLQECVKKLTSFENDVYNQDVLLQWTATFEQFKTSILAIETDIIQLITETFKNKLSSSEGAFDLLNKFRGIKTRDRIEKELSAKYEDVLGRYNDEIEEMKKLYHQNQSNPPIPKNMPPNSGNICWSRSIITRIKSPIDKFKTKPDILISENYGKSATTNYVQTAKLLTETYEFEMFQRWKTQNITTAIEYLSKNILVTVGEGDDKKFLVNFNPRLKVIIREAKFLDRIGKEIPNTIINIALQEKDYMRNIDRLNQLLRSYNDAMLQMRPVEKKLLEKQISSLNYSMDKGTLNHNWFSLSIPEYIRECNKAIESFKEIKGRVLSNAQNIEKLVKNIEEAVLIRPIDFANQEIMDLQSFSEFFDVHREKLLQELVKDYQKIGNDFLKQIEVYIYQTDSMGHKDMRTYYNYWETRILNAIAIMIMRALACNKALWTGRALIKMTAHYSHPDMTFHPTQEELRTQLDKFNRNILDSCQRFGRWWDGHCKIFEETTDKDTSEKTIRFTFYTDIVRNRVIAQLNMEIVTLTFQIQSKFQVYTENFFSKHFKMNFDKNKISQMQKQIEKMRSVSYIEYRIRLVKVQIKENIKTRSDFNQNYIISINFSGVKQSAKEKVGEWLVVLGKTLTDISKQTLSNIIKEIKNYGEQLQKEMNAIEPIKQLLNVIAEIKNKSMDMELKIVEAQEQFRVLKLYKYNVDPDDQEQVNSISQMWNELLDLANRKDHEVVKYKQAYATITKENVNKFKKELEEAYERYKLHGPGASHVGLEEGVDLLQNSKDQCAMYKQQKDENVLSETLFDLEISNYQSLNDMIEKNKIYDQIYDIYKKHREAVKDWSMQPWLRLEINILQNGVEGHEKMVMRLGRTLQNAESYSPFVLLKKAIIGFKNALPLISELRHPAVQERHWKRIMEETEKDLGDINLKTITLSKVFELELQNYQDKVQEICKEAKEEAKNEDSIAKIDAIWKATQFILAPYKRGNEVRSQVITSVEDVRQQLEDNILALQGVGASKYARSIKGRVSQWEADLNLISDVIDLWIVVQNKWRYLESIFASDDIRQQLPEEAKKFQKTDGNFKKVMQGTQLNPNVYNACVKAEGGKRLDELKGISFELEKCQKSLTNYLESKKNILARFYFISDDDLLQILGSSDPRSIQPFLLKLYDNNKELTFAQGNKIITHMTSDEDEKYQFETPVKPEGKIEDWMCRIDDEMKKTLCTFVKRAVFNYAKADRMEWIKKEIGMICIVGTQIWWTFQIEDVFRQMGMGNKHAMKKELAKETNDLNNLIALVRTDVDYLLRKVLNTLIVLDVHARDIIDTFVRDSIMAAKEFEWESQLRFYWDVNKDDIDIRQCTGVFDYCYEYQGLNGRLVITPLTDRCVMTLTTALTFKLGGAPAGPAGTGKTETVKDLAKALALRCVVTCCGEQLDYASMGVIFSGLIQTGFWGCFDEFNRINVEVLSVVSSQIKAVQMGLKERKPKINFLDQDMWLITSIGIFITMNPGYAGRSELPDNLKALFRPVTMVQPDLLLICENMLMSEGFNQAKVLAKKMTVLYKLASEQLSKQYHYDFQLRALKSVLVMAGSLKRAFADLPEDIVLMRALRDMNMPKFVYDDVPLFQGLIADLFPGLQASRVGNEDLKEKISEVLEKRGFKHDQETAFSQQIDKVVQLYETMLTRHTTMVVGPTGAGKSVILQTLAQARKEDEEVNVRIDTMNPKMITTDELYGVLDSETRNWTDGLLSKIFKEANTPRDADSKPETRWILYDGDVDAVWVENMNSVMDDNRILTLANGDRIRLQKYCSMLFEVYDLQYASPATISRCGMVYVDPKNLGYKPFYANWLKIKNERYGIEIHESLKDLCTKFIPPLMDRVFEGINGEDLVEPLAFITPRTNLNLVQQLTHLIDAILPAPDANPPTEFEDLQKLYLFCLTWSVGGALVQEDRDKFNQFLIALAGGVMVHNFYDNAYDIKNLSLDLWEKKVEEYQIPADKKFSSILVPTQDTTRYSWLMNALLQNKRPVMFCGDSGTAKTVTVFSCFRQLNPDAYSILNVNFSSRTSSRNFQDIIEENIDKKTLKSYGPKSAGKKMVLFIDDLNMPNIDKYGTQQPNALLKFLVESNQLYERGGELQLRDIIDIQYVGAMTPPGGGNNRVDPRLMSLYDVFNITFPSKDSIQKIYSSMLKKHLLEFPEECISCIDQITQATLSLYYQCSEKLPRTPVKFHYIFNLRDLSRVYEGLMLSTTDQINTKAGLIRLWRNESLRVFSDRLINETDRTLVGDNLIQSLIKQYFNDVSEDVLKNPILFADYILSDPLDDEKEDPRLYQDIGGWEQVTVKMEKMLEDYGYENKPMPLVLFNDALDHLTKIHRIIRFPRGCALLVGFGGSGKQSLTKLATFVAGYKTWTINLIRNYKEADFRTDLVDLYDQVVTKKRTFMFTDAHVVEQGFLELINNILTIGMVPGLFADELKSGLCGPLEAEIRQKKLPESKEFAWQYFINRCRENMHVVLCMSPAGDTLRIRCRNFPGLVSNTTLDWFFPWPEEALQDVANYFIKDVELDEENRGPVVSHIVMIHTSVQKYSTEFDTVYKRKNYSTPKNYLDFIKGYMRFLAGKRKILDTAVRRLEGGLTTLAKAAEDTKVLSADLAIKNEEIAEKKVIVEALIADITQKSEVAGKKQKEATEKKAYLSVKSVEINEKKEEADRDMEAAAPALLAAKAALQNVKAAQITEIKALANPPDAIRTVCQITFHFYFKDGKVDDWPTVKQRMLGDMKMLDSLKTYDITGCTREQAQRAKKIIAEFKKEAKLDGNELQAYVEAKSVAAGGLFKWAVSTDRCYDIFKEVEPKRKMLESLKLQNAQAMAELEATERALAELNASLLILNADKTEKMNNLQELVTISNQLTEKLNLASKLITGLAGEQIRWGNDMEKFKIDKVKLVGDCLSASSFLSYSGPFNYILRKKMIFEHWKTDLTQRELPNSEDFKLETFLTNEVEVAKWASEGLPSDELSIQNGILTNFASRWPLCIDPQMQAVSWIKDKEKRNNFQLLTFNMGDYIKRLEMAIKFGQPVLFENIDTEIDPMIDPVLEKNIVVEAGVEVLVLGDQKIDYNQDFKLYLTTKIANPNYTPEVFGKTMIINFSVTMSGLRDQLLNEVVGYERPELELKRKQLVVETSANKAELKELEDTLLSELAKADGPLVENLPLIKVLDDAKTKSVKIEGDLIKSKITSEDIEQNRESYKGVAKRGAILFFALSNLFNINEMYEYSLNSYMTVFMNGLETSKKDNVLQARLRFITDKVTQLVYEFTCMGIFEKHKLMFSFQMTTMIIDGNGELNRPELDFFLKGNTSLDEIEAKPNKWISPNGWKDAVKAESLGDAWVGFADSIKKYEAAWRKWYDHETPEMIPMPCGYDKLSRFQKLIVCRIFRNDRCINAIKQFIIEKMGNQYVTSPPILYDKIYAQSTEKTPIVFILSPGADPQGELEILGENLGFGPAKFKYLALGQGMGDKAKAAIESGATRGYWVMLQNCHLLTSWLKKLEAIIEGLTKPDKQFRLWLTTNPSDMFPLGILQRSIKVVTEPPDGLGANVRSAYTKVTEEMLNECPNPEYKALIYVVSFFHATIQERKKFGKIGWNVPYDFNDSDYRISINLIGLYLNKAIETNEEELPWSTLRYLIGEAMYGGRVTDDFDRRVLNTYLKEFMGDFIFDSNQMFFFSRADFQYVIPPIECNSLELINLEIDKIPLFTSPAVFGLHSNAEIQYFSNSVKELWTNTLLMQTSDGAAAGGGNREEYITKVASDIQEKLPAEFDIFNIRKKFETPSPTQIVLLQELERFNILLKLISVSLFDLKRALVGEIGMSSALDSLSGTMFNGGVPADWLRIAPQSLKNLVGWIEHFLRRYKQYKAWDEVEEPKVIWLSGLHIPASYLTALVQMTCRSKGWALDKSTLYTVVLKERDPSKITKRIDQGTYIQGIYIEGARWNTEKDCLDIQRPKELIEEMPLIQIVPVEANKLKLRGTIRTPVYTTQARRNAMGVGLCFEADLRTDRHISHWVLQGVCCVLNTD